MSEPSSNVIPSLMDVLSEAVENAGKDAMDLRPLTRAMGTDGNAKSEKTVKRYLNGEGVPPSGELDAWVRVVASLKPDGDRYALWRAALQRAEDATRAATAEQAARDAGAKSATARQKKSGRPSAREKRG